MFGSAVADPTAPTCRPAGSASGPALLEELFDVEYYVSQCPEVAPAEALTHYLQEGWQFGYCPHPLFSPEFYLAQRGELAEQEPLTDYLCHGTELQIEPHPLFCTRDYKASAQIKGNGPEAWLHYLSTGWRQRRLPHRWLTLDYIQRQLPRRTAGRLEPLGELIRRGPRKNLRFHPLFDPARLSIPLRQRGEQVRRERLVELFMDWPLDFSPSALFDPDFYLARYPHAGQTFGEAWLHFLEEGQFSDCDPNPYFCSARYRERYGRWLRGLSPFLHYMTFERTRRFRPCDEFNTAHVARRVPGVLRSGRSPLEQFLESGRYRSAEIRPFKIPRWLKQHLREAAALEPDVVPKKPLARLPVYNRHAASQVPHLYELMRSSIAGPLKALVLVPHLKRGGADLAAVNLVRWLQQKYGPEQVLLVLTESADLTSADWLPPETRILGFSHYDPKLKAVDRQKLVQFLIEEYLPEHVYNVNSKAAWALFRDRGQPLSKLTTLYAQLFCYDYDAQGRPVGYAIDFLPQSLRYLQAVYTDNDRFRRVLRESFNFPKSQADKIQVLYQPLKPGGYRVPQPNALGERPPARRPRIFWAGRLDRQKRPDVMLEVARHAPEYDFHVFGGSVLSQGKQQQVPENVPSNVQFHGAYNEFFELPLAEADLFLYTSAWDGLPLILIDMMQTGIPIIAPDVGGICELVDNTTGWLVPDFEDHQAYLAAIRDILGSPEECRRRTAAGDARLQEQHAWGAYAAVLEQDHAHLQTPAQPQHRADRPASLQT